MSGVRELFRFAYRRKTIILVSGVLFACAGWMIASVTPPRYSATSALTLDVSKVQIVDREVVSPRPLESWTLRSELDVIRSRSLNDEVVNELGLTSDPAVAREVTQWQSRALIDISALRRPLGRFFPGIFPSDPITILKVTETEVTDWLIGHLNVINDGRTLTILVTFTSENPQRSAQIANAVAKTYLDDQVRAKSRETMKASTWLGERVAEIRQELEKSEAAVDDFRRKSGLQEVKGATIPAERLEGLNAQLSSARLERTRAEVNLQIARESGVEKLPDTLVTPSLQQIRSQLAVIQLQLGDLSDHNASSAFYKDAFGAFYKIKSLKTRAGVLRTLMNAEMSRIVAALYSEVVTARKKEAVISQSFQEAKGQLGEAGHSGLQLIQLQREADANRAIYETFLTRYKQTLQQESLAVPDARLISLAVPPGVAAYPSKVRFLVFGILGGLVLGAGLAFLRESLDPRIRQARQLEAVTGIPVFGFVPKVSRRRGPKPQDYPIADPQSEFCAALARIHAALGAPRSLDHKQVILVTSAQPGEGKTSFCVGLARSLAKIRRRVLVIDADPYRSHVASAFGVSAARVFRASAETPIRLSDMVHADTKSAAEFTVAPNPDDLRFLLHSGGFETLIEKARAAYDTVIIDSPPVMTNADAALIGRFADTRLLLVRWSRTSWDELVSAVGFLRLCRVGLDGIVIVGTAAGFGSYGQLYYTGGQRSEDALVAVPAPDER